MPGPGLSLIGPEEQAEVVDILQRHELSRYRFDDESAEPSKVYQFERELSALTGSPHCLGMNSCTSALYTGLLAAGIGPGDEVIVPAYTFIAPIAAVAHAGAVPVLAEVDESLLLDPADVATRITPRTRAILAVHMLGAPCDLAALTALAEANGLALIEDCAQAGGGSFHGRHLGTVGTFGAFSLNVFKTFTAGDGGVLTTGDRQLYETAFALHDHGAAPLRMGVTDGPALFGLNFRMHELTGAVALAQLRKLPDILSTLRHNKKLLSTEIGEVPGATERPVHDPGGECATVLAYTFDSAELASAVAGRLGTITLDRSGKHNYRNMPQLTQGAMAESRPELPHLKAMPKLAYRPGDLPRTDDLLARTIALSVGVVDSYLGTSAGIDVTSDEARIGLVATKFRTAVAESRKELP
jgi:dTDP-4-amino-4,6-dideoxygalactose transaminase